MKRLFLAILTLLPILSFSQHNERAFKKIDSHAKSAPYFSDPEKLVEYLIEPCKNDWQKTRAIFVWMAHHIAYDTYSYNYNKISHEKCKPMNVYRSRKGVCSGYANLFQFLCGFAGVYCVNVTGYSKGAGYYEGQVFNDTNHSWNVCELNGNMHLFDVTWAAGHVNYSSFKRDFNEFWWDTPPEKFITTHYAVNTVYNNLDRYVSKSQFEQMEPVKRNIATGKPRQIGFNQFTIGGGIARAVPSIPNPEPYNSDKQLTLMFGFKEGIKHEGQNLYGIFSTFERINGSPLTLEAGAIIRRFLRVSAGVRYSSLYSSYYNGQQLAPSVTAGLRINIYKLYAELDLNYYKNTGYFNRRLIFSVGVQF